MSKEAVQEKEERIRRLVRELPDEKRLRYFREVERKIKDPDTYATLNFIFFAGLHHFYLGKWLYGIINMAVFWVGVAMLFTDHVGLGVLVLIGVSVLELCELFRSQVIVQKYNNQVMERVYNSVSRA
ncbi:TM2 domain-containing protein [Arhodomonas aquaeolei]|uniref:TM2 domain-containing protein n=1 Tax=Arhodomonas aquaeolei TaxID=2369 RepID=UPI00216952BB|nr:TM2 domain-containing protein [Arhodomonas aquaeolei]MCS4502593.1 TM2 domain-containing protein [Arhodomonas aquaeolei]